MISFLRGTVIRTDNKYAVLETNQVGYKIFGTATTLADLALRPENRSVWTYLAVREDALDLYAFLTEGELRMFELLISISGIGPKTALGILNVTTAETITHAVTTGETAHLTKIAGIGKKIADKIVLELKGKVDADNESTGETIRDEVEALEALKALGFSHKESRDALAHVDKSITKTQDRIRHALKSLGK